MSGSLSLNVDRCGNSYVRIELRSHVTAFLGVGRGPVLVSSRLFGLRLHRFNLSVLNRFMDRYDRV